MDKIAEFIMTNIVLFGALVIVLALIARSFMMSARIKPVLGMEAIRLMNQQNALLLDVRGNDEYQQGHILNSLHIPLALLDSRQTELAAYKNDHIIICCRSGNRSYHAGLVLKKMGFENLYNLKGGIMAWQQAGLPLTTKVSKIKRKNKKATESAPDEGATDDPGADSLQSAESHNDSNNHKAVSAGKEVVVYTTKLCPFCDRAVNLLSEKGIGYTEIRIDEKPELRAEMERKSSRKTVPQIFVGEKHVGGFDDVYMLESQGRLNNVFGLSS